MEKCQIFISYRRDGGEHLAGRLSDRLRGLGYDVFYDIESMKEGKFNEQIYDAIDSCTDVILVLPPNALDRCVNEDDWVRLEIAHSLKTKKNIIPLLMSGFKFPAALPDDIKEVASMEGVEESVAYFTAMLERICRLTKSQPAEVSEPLHEYLKDGIRFLRLQQYDFAKKCFNNAIAERISDPEAYFYAAVAALEGKRPFLAQRSAITEAEKYLKSAIEFSKNPVYYYFHAFIKHDYYERKKLNTHPSSHELLMEALPNGVTEDEQKALFEVLNIERPSDF